MSQRKAELRSVQEAAAEVGIGSATVWRYLQRGLLKRYRQRIGRKRTLVDVAELRRLIENPPVQLAE
jgi:DNA-directed RNA polymerase specialized sigma24 family protein